MMVRGVRSSWLILAKKLPCKSCQRRDSTRQRFCWDCRTSSFLSKRKQTNKLAVKSSERTIIIKPPLSFTLQLFSPAEFVKCQAAHQRPAYARGGDRIRLEDRAARRFGPLICLLMPLGSLDVLSPR